ncbi:succinate--CoA ligase subunit beta [Leptolyngbya ohadii]|uniref:succinate--CoA ligase subunit beta n=1 Tax=Leptolyngbya ohadii TaxID=1962290 RepID=UPI000B59B603|nr:succinate--CoA ligase subunit beta [Leptolyngbya ohadii]
MELLEYQAKELFRQMGIPVLPSQRICQIQDIKQLSIPYPVVLKSQVYTGGRGKAGGIKFAENTIDAIAAAQMIFHLPIMGKYPEVLLAEAKYDADREFYLAVVLDSSERRPVLLGSQQGGIDIESQFDRLHQVIVDQEFSPYYARRLAIGMGLQGSLIQSVSAIVEKMYRLFITCDLDLVEINPLAVSSSGELMALDGKVTVNDTALGRQALLSEFTHPLLLQGSAERSQPATVSRVDLSGNIGVLCNGAGLTMATLDLLYKAKGRPGAFVDVGGEYRQNSPQSSFPSRIQQGLDLLFDAADLRVILVNLLGNRLSCVQIAEMIAAHVQQRGKYRSLPSIVVRLVGEELPQARAILEPVGIFATDYLDTAITQTLSLLPAKSS